MAKLSKDGSVGTLHPRETLLATGLLGALNAEVICANDGGGTVFMQTLGTFSLTHEVSGSLDGTNWTPIPVRAINQPQMVYGVAIVSASPTLWAGKSAGYRFIRVRASAYTSGAASILLSSSTIPLDDPDVTPLLVTATGAAGAAVTLTLPAPGTGLRQYIDWLRIERHPSGVLTPAATPTIVTSTNIPGALAWSVAADAAAQGVPFIINQEFPKSIPCSAQNTATTIIMPATPNVIWRASGGYRLGN